MSLKKAVLRPEVKDYLAAFNSHRFFEAHEILEAPWRRPGDPFFKDDGVRGLIFAAALYVHRGRGNPVGVAHMAEKAWRVLEPRAPIVHGVDVGPLLNLLATAPRDASFPFVTLRAP